MEPLLSLESFIEQVRSRPEKLDRVLRLTQNSNLDNFVNVPQTVYNFGTTTDNRYVPLALELMKLDSRLDALRLKCVPARVKEEVFWRNYLSRVFDIALEDQENSSRPLSNPAMNDENAFADVFQAFHGVVTSLSKGPTTSDASLKSSTTDESNSLSLDPAAFDVLKQFRDMVNTKVTPVVVPHRKEMMFLVELLQTTQTLRETWIREHEKSELIDGLPFALQAFLNQSLSKSYPSYLLLAKLDGMTLRARSNLPLRSAVIPFLRSQTNEFALMDDDSIVDAIGVGLYDGGDSDWHWIVNTIADTIGPQAISVALINVKTSRVVTAATLCDVQEEGETRAAIYCAAENTGTWVRTKDNSGQWKEPSQILLKQTQVFAEAEQFCKQADDLKTADRLHQAQIMLEELYANSAHGYLCVLHGTISAYVVPRSSTQALQALDHAVGSLLLVEAGSTISDLNGKDLEFRSGRLLRDNQGIIAASSRMSARLRAAINKVTQPDAIQLTIKIRQHFIDHRVIKRLIAEGLNCSLADIQVELAQQSQS